MKHAAKILLVSLAFLGGMASIVCLLINLAGYGGHVRCDAVLIYGGYACVFIGRTRIREFWQKFVRNRKICLLVRFSLLAVVLGMGVLLLYRSVIQYGYDVLSDDVTVAIGHTAYSTLAYGMIFLIMVADVIFLTSLPKKDSADVPSS